MSTTPTHYQPTGTGPPPWDLEKTMQSSGSAFVDARRTDAIEYCFRLKGGPAGLLEDLKKARHCIDEAINYLDREAHDRAMGIEPDSMMGGLLKQLGSGFTPRVTPSGRHQIAGGLWI